MKKRVIAAALFAVALGAAPASAAEGFDGVGIRGFANSAGKTAVLFGGEGTFYTSGPFYLGGAGSGGPVLSEPRSAFGYGGVMLGATDTLFGRSTYDLRLLVGGGGGAIGADKAAGLVLEPSLALGLKLDEKSRVSLTAGYLYMPEDTAFSGATFGLRFNFAGSRR
ncbi:hypothetical protein J7643_09365 [bacterium]|nr:hypothetical protein [bacterium]